MIRFAAFCLILTTAATITACDGAPVQPPPPSEEAFHAADTDLLSWVLGQSEPPAAHAGWIAVLRGFAAGRFAPPA